MHSLMTLVLQVGMALGGWGFYYQNAITAQTFLEFFFWNKLPELYRRILSVWI